MSQMSDLDAFDELTDSTLSQ